jgi:cardiolipin synthase
MLPVLSSSPWLTLHALAVLVGLLAYAGLSLATHQRRHPSAAIAWVLALALLPYAALPVFLLFGNRKIVRAKRVPHAAPPMPVSGPGARFRSLAAGLGLPPAVAFDDLRVHDDGRQALNRLCELLAGAQRSIDVATFLIGRDAVGDELTALLARRAREGVRVRLLLDGVGRYLGGVVELSELRAAGVDVRLFANPWPWPFKARSNLRNHRKLVVVDGARLWAGGRNLAAAYFGEPHRDSAWHKTEWADLSFDLAGDAAAQGQLQFEHDWQLAVDGPLPAPALPAAAPEGAPLAQLLPSGPDQAEDTLQQLLLDGCFSAQRRILAVTPYFVPDPALLTALMLAARRGVAVHLVLPRRSNHLLADLARPAALRDLIGAGAYVWLVPRMVHAKLVVFDDTIALAGSLNLDQRSLFLNYELMVAFYDGRAVDAFAAWGERLRVQGQLLERQRVGLLREVGEGLLRWLTFQL